MMFADDVLLVGKNTQVLEDVNRLLYNNNNIINRIYENRTIYVNTRVIERYHKRKTYILRTYYSVTIYLLFC